MSKLSNCSEPCLAAPLCESEWSCRCVELAANCLGVDLRWVLHESNSPAWGAPKVATCATRENPSPANKTIRVVIIDSDGTRRDVLAPPRTILLVCRRSAAGPLGIGCKKHSPGVH